MYRTLASGFTKDDSVTIDISEVKVYGRVAEKERGHRRYQAGKEYQELDVQQ